MDRTDHIIERRLRDQGALPAVLSFSSDLSDAALIDAARAEGSMEGRDLVSDVTCAAPTPFTEGSVVMPDTPHGKAGPTAPRLSPDDTRRLGGGRHVVVYDFGVKRNILRELVDLGFRVTTVPATFSASATLDLRPDGVLLSNGPGDPAALDFAVAITRGLLDSGVPLFGICLGHQLLGRALGGATYKLKFGHHGVNQPVLDLSSGQVEITSQNHGFAVDLATLSSAELTHRNLNDGTVEGFRVPGRPVFAVQYHPEAAPGPHDASYLFTRFGRLCAGESPDRALGGA